MDVYATGISHQSGQMLFPPLEEGAFAARINASLTGQVERLRRVAKERKRGITFRGEVERRRLPDPGDPKEAGWTYLVHRDDPDKQQIMEIMRPLAEHRGMRDPLRPLLYHEEVSSWDWLTDNYFALGLTDQLPHYVAIVGPPTRISFRTQSLLDGPAAVGRLDFDRLEELGAYVAKVIRLDTAPEPVARREALFFAPNGGLNDATYYSEQFMARPLSEHVREKHGLTVHRRMGDEATKPALLELFASTRPAFVYTASHGLGPPEGPLELQKKLGGALCCQRRGPMAEWLLTAEELPRDEPLLEGAVFFQFACFGAGVPAFSDYEHWLTPGQPKRLAEEDFVSAIPKRLLANPRGPIGFIGHVDTAWLHGFADPDNPITLERWSNRIVPFKKAIDLLLEVQPAGLSMGDINKQLDVGNAVLIDHFDQLQRGGVEMTPERMARITDVFIRRGDAQNYIVLGDPACRTRIPSP
jgi:hypothetical protein